jgi:opacity protein-like surface antigen
MLKWGIGVAAATLATAFAGGAAQAQQSYIGLGAGWTRIDSADITIENGVSAGNDIVMTVDLDDDWAGRASYGWDFGTLRIEGEFGMTAADANSYRSTRPPNVTRQTDGTINLVTGMINGYVDFDGGQGVTPFIGAGAGPVKLEVEVFGPRPTAPNAGSVSLIDNDEVNFGWQAMAGFSVPVAANMAVTAQFRYFDAGSFGTTDTLGHATSVDIKGSSWDAGLRWTF